MSEIKRELNPEEMSRVSGGSSKTIRTRQAAVYTGPGKEYGQAGSLPCGSVINFTGNVSYNDKDGLSWYQINSPVPGWVTRNDLA